MTQGLEPDWDSLKALEGDLITEFASSGVQRVEYVVAFVEPFAFCLWPGTRSDEQRDSFPSDAIDNRIRSVVAKHGLGRLYEGYTVESQETVDREYEGSWFNRLR